MVVYMIINNVNDMVYVGQTTGSLSERMSDHRGAAKRGHTGLLYRDIRECGWDAFDVVVLERCDTIEQLNAYERVWIEETSACEHGVGYNQRDGGHNKRLSAEARQRCREAGAKGGAYGKKSQATSQSDGALSFKHPNAARPRAQMTDAERERFREWGRLGARGKRR